MKTETLERILEIAIVTDNIRAAVSSGELTEEQGKEITDSILKGIEWKQFWMFVAAVECFGLTKKMKTLYLWIDA